MMISFKTFRCRYSEAADADSLDIYIDKCCRQECMESSADNVDILAAIYSMVKGGIPAVIETSGLNKKRFCQIFGVSERGMFYWLSGERKAPAYTLLLLAYAALSLKLDAD